MYSSERDCHHMSIPGLYQVDLETIEVLLHVHGEGEGERGREREREERKVKRKLCTLLIQRNFIEGTTRIKHFRFNNSWPFQ